VIEGLLTLFQHRSPLLLLRDLFDIAVVAYAVYRLLLLLRGTRAMQVGLGLALVVLVVMVAQRAGLATAYTLLNKLFESFLLLVVVIFQSDIRRALMRVGNRPFLLRWRKTEETSAVEEVISACALLAQRRVGALIVFEREGTLLDADVSRELLYTIFLPGYENPLHDGAVIIKNARVWKAGTFLPLTANPSVDRTLGTRHRAALGISEDTDAVVVIVSEERGQVSLCFNGNIVRGLDSQSLRQALYGLFYSKRRAAALLKGHAAGREREGEPGGRAAVTGPHRPSVAPPDPGGRRERDREKEREREREQGVTAQGAIAGRGDETARERPVRAGEERRSSVRPPALPGGGDDEGEGKARRPAKPKEV
jgi:diadenylate cyclase